MWRSRLTTLFVWAAGTFALALACGIPAVSNAGPYHWAGPIGLLAALLFVQRGFDSHVFDRAAEGRKPDMVGRVGATYHHGDAAELPPGGSRLRKRTSAD